MYGIFRYVSVSEADSVEKLLQVVKLSSFGILSY
jgi:hypothetical protein